MTDSLNAVGRGGVRRGLAAAVAVLLAVLASLGLAAGPAAAHSGGKANVLVEALDIAPAASGGYTATLQIADFDGGGALINVDVKASGAGLTALTPMAPTSTPGEYQVALPKAVPGPIEFVVQARTLPGAEGVNPFDAKYQGTLEAGQVLNLVKATGSDEGGSSTGMIAGVAGAVLLVAVLYGLFAMRKKSAVPAQAK